MNATQTNVFKESQRQLAGEFLKQAAQDLQRHGEPTMIERELTSAMSDLSSGSTAVRANFDVSRMALRCPIAGGAIKYNINVIKSVWQKVRKPSRATLEAVSSKNSVCTEMFSKKELSSEQADLTIIANLSKAGWDWLCRRSRFSRPNLLRLLTHMATKKPFVVAGRI